MLAANREKALLVRGSEVALFVEDIVERQEHLRLDELDVTVAEQCCGVHDVLASAVMRRRDVSAEDGGGAVDGLRGNLLNDLPGARDEGWLLKQIGGRIAADG